MESKDFSVTKDDIEKVFYGESYYRTLDLLEKARRLVPIGDESKAHYLLTLIEFVDGLINGDEITELTTRTYMSNMAKDSLEKIVHDVHERTLEVFLEQRATLQKEVSSLSNSKEGLTSQVEDLEQRKSSLLEQTSSLGIEVAQLKKELADLKQNGFKEAEVQVQARRQELKDEIARMEETKKGLESYLDDLKKSVSSYNSVIDSLAKGTEEVVWEKVKDNDPIYGITGNNMGVYIQNLKKEYMRKTGCSEKDCTTAFNTNALVLETLYYLMKRIDPDLTLGYILTMDEDDLYEGDVSRRNSLIKAVEVLKLPVYQPKRENIDAYILKPKTVPTNINVMLRELYLQRTLAEEMTKRQIVEAELRSVLNVLMAVAPKDYDFSSLSSMYSSLDSDFSSLIDSPGLKLNNPNL